MATRSTTCDGCHYSREQSSPSDKLECHVHSMENWHVRSRTSWCGDWRDPAIVYRAEYQPRRLGLVRYLNQLLTSGMVFAGIKQRAKSDPEK